MSDFKCGCGKEACYSIGDSLGDNVFSCNKHQRCKTYDELQEDSEKSRKVIAAFISTVNNIDDYFEYRNESLEDRKKVHQLLGNLTDKLKELL